MSTLLSIKNLNVNIFSDKSILPVINNVNIDLKEGEVLGIVGESGCGKSMLASAVMGLLSPPAKVTNGEILFENEDLVKLSQKELQNIRGSKISMIFQEPMTSLNPLMKCGRQIEEVLFTHEKLGRSELRKKAIHAISEVGIGRAVDVYNDIPSRLSGGMRQRIMIAMALICNPRLLICDEPTTALDVTIQAQILKLIKEIQNKKKTSVIFISHDMGVISKMADRVAVMYAGQIVEIAGANEIFTNPKHPYTIGLLRAIPDMNTGTKALHDIRGSVPMLDALPNGCLFSPRCDIAIKKCFKERPKLKGDKHCTRCFVVNDKENYE